MDWFVPPTWIFLIGINSEAILMRRKGPTEDLPDRRHTKSHSVLSLVNGCLARKLHGATHTASGTTLKRARNCEQPNSEDGKLRVAHVSCHVFFVRPIGRELIVVGDFLFPLVQDLNLIRRPCAIGAWRNWPESEKRAAHSFWRGSARALISTGGVPPPNYYVPAIGVELPFVFPLDSAMKNGGQRRAY